MIYKINLFYKNICPTFTADLVEHSSTSIGGLSETIHTFLIQPIGSKRRHAETCGFLFLVEYDKN